MKCIVVRSLAALVPLTLFAPCALAETSLVSTGAVWKYLDTGVDQGSNWRTPAFDDTPWLSGPAQLGFGDNDEATRLSQTNSVGVTNLTFYFRHHFTVSDVTAYSNLLVRLRRDDGAVVYLNGTEIFRSNMPLGPVGYATLASTTTSDDGAGWFAAPANAGLLALGANVLAVEVHQAATNSSDISFDLELVGNVIYQHPTVSITSPTNGAAVNSANLTVRVNAADPDGSVDRVEFFANGQSLGLSMASPFTFIQSNVTAGSYSLMAVAVDTTGLSATSAPVTVSVPLRLIPSGAVWRYLDDGSDPGSSWFTAAFDASSWSNGPAQLGFGDGDEATRVRQTNNAGTTNITFYFRHEFEVASLTGISNLVLRLIRDDGAVAYLNGTEVFRINMPTGALSSVTFASQVIGNDNEFHATRVNPSLLVPGRNVLAVAMHQFNLTSSDISFDLELRPNVIPSPPNISIVTPTNNIVLFGPTNVTVGALALDPDDAVTSVSFYLSNTLRGVDLTDSYDVAGRNYSLVLSNLDAGAYVVRAVATDAAGLTRTSAPVTLNIQYAPVLTTLLATGSVWKYVDAAGDQGTAWRAPGFDDSAWLTGTAKFGTTNDGATTPISLSQVTTYFRHRFSVTGAASVTNLAFRVLRDDGVVAYLNNVEVFRNNMPTGQVFFSTLAPMAIGGTNEFYYMLINTNADALLNGVNVLAVELHQSAGTSDAGFDLGLTGVALPAAIAPALNINYVGADLVVSWTGNGFTLQEALRVDGPYNGIASAPNSYIIPNPSSGSRYYRLFKP